MEAILKEINNVLGVTGSFVCLSDGSLAAQAMPERFDDARLALGARVASQTFQALEVSGQRVTEADLLYGQGRLILKNLRGGILVILCARNINFPLLNLTANVAVKKLSAELKLAKAPATSAPAAPTVKTAPQLAPVPAPTPTPLLLELEQEIHRLIDAAQNSRVTLRVINPLGLWLCCPRTRALVAQPGKRHLDFAALAAQSSSIVRVFEQAGYQGNQRFNAFYGDRRLNFNDAPRDLSVDIYLDAFEMYHRLDLKTFLAQEGIALPETALLLTRLQMVEIDDAGLGDICALLLEHDLGIRPEQEKIDASQITRLCADDWGWYKTVSMNLDRVVTFAASALSPSEQAIIVERVQRLLRGMDEAPKSLRWLTRARLGESTRWYETPLASDRAVRPDMAFG